MKTLRRTLALLLTVCMCFCGVSACALADETYTATANGMGEVTVTLTVADGKITAADVDTSNETAGFGLDIADELAAQLVAAGSADIDGVSGCTVTSTAVKVAAASALEQAGVNSGDNKLVPGIYEGRATALRGELVVHVTVSEDAILAVDVISHVEHPDQLNEAPLKEIPAAIVEQQSANVDVVTGATLTSLGIMNAVRDALKQAGNTTGFETKTETTITHGEDVTTDILVVGGGGAGASAALNAKYAGFIGEDNGLKVILIEKQGFLGGNTLLSGGWVAAAVPLNSQEYIDEHLEDQVFAGLDENANKALIEKMYRISGETLLNMQQTGYSIITDYAMGDADDYGYIAEWLVGAVDTTDTDDFRWSQGWRLGQYFTERLTDSDIDVRLNTAADELLLDETGAVIGVHVTAKDSEYNIYAKKVILATGGFANNEELIEKYCPQFSGIAAYVNAGSTGDAFTMAEAVDAVVVVNRAMKNLGTDSRTGIWSDLNEFHCLDGYSTPTGTVYPSTQGLILVNTDGERFCFDGTGYGTGSTFNAIIEQPGKTSFAIIDSNHPFYDVAEASTEYNYKFKADTIAELAEMIGVPADTLEATVAAYNASIESGETDEFGVAADQKNAVLEAPFYAVVVNPILPAIYAGMQVDENCQLLNSKGEVVENLYAVGDTCNYSGELGALGAVIYTGRIAAEDAAARILGE